MDPSDQSQVTSQEPEEQDAHASPAAEEPSTAEPMAAAEAPEAAPAAGSEAPEPRRRRSGMGLASKLTFGVLFPATLVAVAVLAVAFLAVRGLMQEHQQDLATAAARGLAASAEDLLVIGDAAALQMRVAELSEGSELAYVIVIDENDRAVAHDFTPTVPAELLASAGPRQSRERVFIDPEAGVERRVTEVEVPITSGQLGRVKVGVDLGDIDRAAVGVLRETAAAAGGGLVLAWLIGLWIGRRTAKPVRRLVDTVDRITRDDLESMTSVGSRDEIGLLAETINDAILHLRSRLSGPASGLGFGGAGFDGVDLDAAGIRGNSFEEEAYEPPAFDAPAVGGAAMGMAMPDLGSSASGLDAPAASAETGSFDPLATTPTAVGEIEGGSHFDPVSPVDARAYSVTGASDFAAAASPSTGAPSAADLPLDGSTALPAEAGFGAPMAEPPPLSPSESAPNPFSTSPFEPSLLPESPLAESSLAESSLPESSLAESSLAEPSLPESPPAVPASMVTPTVGTGEHEPRAELRVEMAEVLGLSRALAEGELGSRGRVTADAVGVVVESLNLMAEGLAETIEQLRAHTGSITSTASQTVADSDATKGLTDQQVEGVGQASARVASVEEAVGRMAEGCRHVEASATEARNHVGASRESVVTSVARLEQLRHGVESLGEKVKGVGERAMEIMEAVDLLSRVATQTHLLSLNAAIEASSAGEEGVRFGVVATEMRQLSAEVGMVSKQLDARVRAIRNEVQAAVATVEDGTQGMHEGLASVEQVGERLGALEGLVERTSGLGGELAQAAPDVAGEIEALREMLESLDTAARRIGSALSEERERAEETRKIGALQIELLSRYQTRERSETA